MEHSADNQPPAAEAPTTVSVEDIDVDFLSIIYEIVRGLERETSDSSQKPPSASQDISQKVVELNKKLELAKDQIKRLPGVEHNKEQQIEKLEGLRKQLRLKRELLLKYRTMFLMNDRIIDKLADSYPFRRAAKWAVFFLHKARTIKPEEALSNDNLKNIASKFEENLKKVAENLEKKAKRSDGYEGPKYERFGQGSNDADCCQIVDHFKVSPAKLPKRIMSSFIPPIFGSKSRQVYVDFSGPCIAVILLWTLLEIGHSDKHPLAIMTIPPVLALSYYCLAMPMVCIFLAKMGSSDITLSEVIALLGYGLYGHAFTLLFCFIFNIQTSYFFFFTIALVLCGPSCLRLILVFLFTIPKPIARLLVCSVVAVFHVLFLIFVHFAYMHRTFVYGAASVKTTF